MAMKLILRWLFRAWSVFLASRLRAELGKAPEHLRRDVAHETETPTRHRFTRVPAVRPNQGPACRRNPLPGFVAKPSFHPPTIGVL